MTIQVRLVLGVVSLSVVTGLCLPSWTTITGNPAVAGMWAMVVVFILLVIFVGGKRGH
jgi:hypothetical protein